MRARTSGFTLLELSIALVIIGMVAAISLMAGKGMLESAERAATQNKLDEIERALTAYRVTNNRLPCPADVTLAKTSASWGIEAANKGVCTGGSPAATFSATISGTGGKKVVEGAVPTKTLGLPDEFANDAWGRRIQYAVTAVQTAEGAFTSYGMTQECSFITVKDAADSNRTTSAVYALVSFGPNGHGGYVAAGARMNAGSTNTQEQTNCHCNSSAANTAYAATYVQRERTESTASPTNIFDDLVRYKERWQMQTVVDGHLPAGTSPCTDGFRVDGANATFIIGRTTAFGDINGDGYDDMLVSSYDSTGNVYVVFGTFSKMTSPLSVASLTGANGFALTGAAGDSTTTYSGLAAGDVNGDGYDDLIIGVHGRNSTRGGAYVVFGRATWSSASYALSATGSTLPGFYLDGVAGRFGAGMATLAADVNDDGYDDIIVGSPSNDTQGRVYVVFGQAVWSAASYNLSNTGGTLGGSILSSASDAGGLGYALAKGDINGDGKMDLIIGGWYSAPSSLSEAGSVFVVFGRASWAAGYTLDSGFLNGTNGFRINGDAAALRIGSGVGSGDINGDGYGDVLTGTGDSASYTPTNTGYGYIVYGKSSWSSGTYTVSNVGTVSLPGVRIDGGANGDVFGYFSAAGDLNNDGYDDAIISGFGYNSYQGYVAVVFGSGSLSSPVAVSSLNGTNGFRVNGAAGAYIFGVAPSVGNFQGDNYADLQIGAMQGRNGSAVQTGNVYLLHGKQTWTSGTYQIDTMMP